MNHSEQMNELLAALSLAQGEIDNALKDADNPHFKSKFADLASVRDAIRGPLAKHKLCYVQTPEAEGAKVTVTTMLGHASGQWVSGSLTLTARDATPQSVGSAITYARRYGLSAIVGVAPEEDDGNAASAPPRQAAHRVNGVTPAPANKPRTVAERVAAFSAQMVGLGLAVEGDVEKRLTEEFGPEWGPMRDWPEAAADRVREACKAYERKAREFIGEMTEKSKKKPKGVPA